ncbi:MAG: tRNA epoxyqueuosine(34) reductase QueG [Candidatus Kapaibacterium sp.]
MSINSAQIKSKLIQKALDLGFLDLKSSAYQILEDESKYYDKWLSCGYNADMQWMERNIDKRRDISLVLPEIMSIFTLSYNYFTGNIHKKNLGNDEGKTSRYAWGSDYHDIVLDKLNQLIEFAKSMLPESNWKAYVDTGPILEKQWALKSGLGWQGKNSLILSKNHGSYFFIGVLLTDHAFPADIQVKDYCGSCTKCIKACPTQAIVADKVIDSNKCISYWTIEAKADKSIPVDIAENAENWIYGCDICQEVCPWNKILPKMSEENLFKSRLDNGILNKAEIDSMSQEEFSNKFRKSPVKRLKLAGLKRNSRDILK